MPPRGKSKRSLLARVLWVLVPLCLVAGALAFVLWPRRQVFYSDGERTWPASPDLGLRSVLWDDGARVEGLGDPRQDYDPCLSADGQELYFTRGKAGGAADLYVAYRALDGWTDPEPLAALNTDRDEIGPAIDRDASALYFYSNRAGGEGGYDLYVARKTADAWQTPENLGPAVNTPFNEYDPSLSPDGRHLLFASNRPVEEEERPEKTDWPATLREGRYENDYDIYAVDLSAPSAPPRRLADLCSGSDDGQPTVSRDGRWLYFASNRAGGQGGYDIWRSRITVEPLAGFMAPENLGRPVNTAAHELDPALSLEGFGLYFSSDRSAPDAWAIYYARSHEVFRVVRTRRLAIGHILGRLSWPLIGLILALVGLVLTVLALARLRRRPGLLATAMMVSLIVHLMALSLFTIWHISRRVSELARDEERFEVVVSLPDLAESEVSSKLRVALEDFARTDTAKLAPEKSQELTAPEPPAPEVPKIALARAEPEARPRPLEITRPEVRPADLAETLSDRPRPAPSLEPLLPEPVPEVRPKPVREPEPAERPADRPVRLARRDPIRPATRPSPRHRPRATVRPAPPPETTPMRLPEAVPPRESDPDTFPAPQITRPEPQAVAAEEVIDLAPAVAKTPLRPVRVAADEPETPVSTRPLSAARAETSLPEPAAPAPAAQATAPKARPVPPTAAIADVAPPTEPADAGPVVLAETLARGPAVPPADVNPAEALPPALGPVETKRPAPRSNGEAEPQPAPRTLVTIERSAGPVAAEAGPRPTAPTSADELRLDPQAVAARPLASETLAAMPAAPTPALEVEPAKPGPPAMPAAPATIVDLAEPTPPAAPRTVRGPGPVAVVRPRESLATGRPRTAVPDRAAPQEAVPEAGTVGETAAPAEDVRLASAAPEAEALATPRIGDALREAALPPTSPVEGDLAPPPAPLPPKEIYRLRTRPDRKEQIEKLGGTPETEEAVRRALAWFARHQSPDGRWDVDAFMKNYKHKNRRADGGGRRKRQDVGVTALAALAFIGAGHTHVPARGAEGPTEYARTVRQAVDWLLEGQTKDGDLRRDGQMYDHCLAMMVLCESYSMTGEERLADPIRKALDFTLKAQNPGKGWRYEPRSNNDTSVVGWALMALKSAEIAGFQVPRKAYRGAANWLDRVRKGKHKGLYEYQPGRNPSPAMTAEGLFSEMLIDYNPGSPRTMESVRYLLDHEPRYDPRNRESTNLYYWYYATLALHQLGGEPWETWNRMVRDALVKSQRTDGPFAGSWDTRTRWGDYGGRVYTTAMATLTLEVYYRYLPFYDLRLETTR